MITLYLIFLPPSEVEAEYTRLKLTTELENCESFTVRATIIYQTVKAFCIVENDSLDSFGFSTPFSALGPLVRSGLLREITNPLAYTATSSVFSEKTDLRLTAALDGSSYWGLALKPLPENCMVYYLGKKDKPFAIGAVIRLEWERFFLFESLIATSEPPAQQVDDIWFEEKPIFAGGRLVHISPKFKLTWHNFSCLISGSLSCGSLVVPGYYLHTVCSYHTALVQTALILGYLNKDYVNPYGEYNNKNILYGGSITLTPSSWLKLEQEYERLIYHGRPADQGFRECKEKLSSSVEFSFTLTESIMFNLNEDYCVSFHFDTDNEFDCVHKLISAAAVEHAVYELAVELKFDHIGLDDQSLTAELKLEIHVDPVTIYVTGKRIESQDTICYSCAFSLYLKLENHKFYLKTNTNKNLDKDNIAWQDLSNDFYKYISLTLGWEGVW
ncbi:MAG: hypothetical protein JW822_01785 [Spirochaetales bacterium]|nr:hypothetical protein [Spirochaetales bacterium]